MPEHNDPPLISKHYLFALLALVLLIVLNLLFNSVVRDYLGLKKGVLLSFNLFKSQGRKGGVVTAAAPAFTAKEFSAFSDSFTQRKVPQGLMIVTNEAAKPTPVRGGQPPLPPPPPPPPPPPCTWPVRVQGAYQDLKGQWTAIVSGHNVRAGDRLASGTEGKCVYSLLAIGNQCVWLRVIPPGIDSAKLAKLPENIVWPNVALIELDRKLLRPDYVPARVRLGNGTTLGKNDALKYPATGTSFRVRELWMNGAIFVVSNNDATVELACVLVAQ